MTNYHDAQRLARLAANAVEALGASAGFSLTALGTNAREALIELRDKLLAAGYLALVVPAARPTADATPPPETGERIPKSSGVNFP